MLQLTESAERHFKVAIEKGEIGDARLRVFIDHRCHCGKAHFSLSLDDQPARDDMTRDDTTFEIATIPFVADTEAASELDHVEIDFVETVWTKGFTINNLDHQCGAHMMD